MHDLRGAKKADIHHHMILIFKKKPIYIILNVGTNDATSRVTRKILNALL